MQEVGAGRALASQLLQDWVPATEGQSALATVPVTLNLWYLAPNRGSEYGFLNSLVLCHDLEYYC